MNREDHIVRIKELRKDSDYDALLYWMKHGREISFKAFSGTGELCQSLERERTHEGGITP